MTVTDPIPNGGTVVLTLPDGSTRESAFSGTGATLPFADFGMPNGYSGVHKPGDVLNFTADVTTAAGYAAFNNGCMGACG